MTREQYAYNWATGVLKSTGDIDEVKRYRELSNTFLNDPEFVKGVDRALSEHTKGLATFLAEKLFEAGDEYNSPCTRIEFKGGILKNEVEQGGLNLKTLVTHFEKNIKEYNNY